MKNGIFFSVSLVLFGVSSCASQPTRQGLCDQAITGLTRDYTVAMESLNTEIAAGRSLASAAEVKPGAKTDARASALAWREWGIEHLARVQDLSDQIERLGVTESEGLKALTESADELVLVYSYADLGETDRLRESLILAASRHMTATEGICQKQL